MDESSLNAAAEHAVSIYCDAWNETDPARRLQMLQEIWADGATYTDPTVHTVGRGPLAEHIGRVLERFPGSRIVMTSDIDLHHRVLRFTWRRILADGTQRPEGIDFGEIGEDGKLTRIVGFFGPPPQR